MFREHSGSGLDVVGIDLHDVGHQVTPTLAIGCNTLKRCPCPCDAVIPTGAAEDDLAVRFTLELGDLSGQLERGVNRLRT